MGERAYIKLRLKLESEELLLSGAAMKLPAD